MYGQSGYAGERPKNTVVAKYGNVEVEGVAYAQLLNPDDPDVSFAYTFCGSAANHEAAKKTMERGITKAQFKEIPAILPDVTAMWVKSFVGFSEVKLLVFIGENDHRALAEPTAGNRFDFDMAGIEARYQEDDLVITERLPLNTELFSWYLSAKEKVVKARHLRDELDKLGVAWHEDD